MQWLLLVAALALLWTLDMPHNEQHLRWYQRLGMTICNMQFLCGMVALLSGIIVLYGL